MVGISGFGFSEKHKCFEKYTNSLSIPESMKYAILLQTRKAPAGEDHAGFIKNMCLFLGDENGEFQALFRIQDFLQNFEFLMFRHHKR